LETWRLTPSSPARSPITTKRVPTDPKQQAGGSGGCRPPSGGTGAGGSAPRRVAPEGATPRIKDGVLWRAGTCCKPRTRPAQDDPPASSTPLPPKRRSLTVRLLPSGPDPVPAVGPFGLPSGRHPGSAGLEGRGFTVLRRLVSDPDATLQVFGSALSTCREAGANPASLVPACRRVAIIWMARWLLSRPCSSG